MEKQREILLPSVLNYMRAGLCLQPYMRRRLPVFPSFIIANYELLTNEIKVCVETNIEQFHRTYNTISVYIFTS